MFINRRSEEEEEMRKAALEFVTKKAEVEDEDWGTLAGQETTEEGRAQGDIIVKPSSLLI